MYLSQLKRWHQYFETERLLVVTTEEFSAEPDRTLNRIFRFLDLEPATVSTKKQYNTGGYSSKMNPEILQRLKATFNEPNRELAEYLGRDPEWGRD